jgi:hypothetical protein
VVELIACAFFEKGFACEDLDHHSVRSRPTQMDFGTVIAMGTAKVSTKDGKMPPATLNVRALDQATHGYRSWMGPVESFQDGYRDGYRRGFREGYETTNRRWRDRGYDEDYKY